MKALGLWRFGICTVLGDIMAWTCMERKLSA